MARGRKALPDEIKALKGNPGKRRLNLDAQDAVDLRKVERPKYLTGAAEREIFSRVSEELNRIRFIRHTDVDALARWCSYMAKWISLKERVDKKKADVYYETESKHGTMLRVHPIFASMLQIERMLMALEDRIGLNPSARQSILRGLISGPALPQGNLFGEAEKPAAQAPAKEAAPAAKSFFGCLN